MQLCFLSALDSGHVMFLSSINKKSIAIAIIPSDALPWSISKSPAPGLLQLDLTDGAALYLPLVDFLLNRDNNHNNIELEANRRSATIIR